MSIPDEATILFTVPAGKDELVCLCFFKGVNIKGRMVDDGWRVTGLQEECDCEHRGASHATHVIFRRKMENVPPPTTMKKVDDASQDLYGWDGYDEVKKFVVLRPDGMNKDAKYFVLDLTFDPIARLAARVYAQMCHFGRNKLAVDLVEYCDAIERQLRPVSCPRCRIHNVTKDETTGLCMHCGPKM